MEGFGPAARYQSDPLAVSDFVTPSHAEPSGFCCHSHKGRNCQNSLRRHTLHSAADAPRLIIQVRNTVSARTYDMLYLLLYLLTIQASPQSSVIPTVMSRTAVFSRESVAGTCQMGVRSAKATTSTTTRSMPWWRVAMRSTSTCKMQPATGCGGMVKVPLFACV